MREVVLNAPACLVLGADMIIRRRAAGLAYAGMLATLLVLSIFDVNSATPTVHGELIITRRDTGGELLRTDTDLPLAHVRGQLDEMTVAEFLDRWDIDPDLLFTPG